MAQMRVKNPGFEITGGKGFHITFENGWTVSVQFGGCNYGGNYDAEICANPVNLPASATAEVAAWPRGGAMIEMDGDTVGPYQTPAQVLALLNDIASRPDEATTAKSTEIKGVATT